jgi:hypothetical protein
MHDATGRTCKSSYIVMLSSKSVSNGKQAFASAAGACSYQSAANMTVSL